MPYVNRFGDELTLTPVLEEGKHYKLTEEVVNEHQDHFFTYPKGTVFWLDFVSEHKDDRTPYLLYHFTTRKGDSNTFAPEMMEPATEDDWQQSKICVIIEPGPHDWI